ncbi:MAG: hypothetical protein H6909_03890 [Rickettsiaceae bacterium]|nr:hypothetical protein [Rickettsiaceae bacterium]
MGKGKNQQITILKSTNNNVTKIPLHSDSTSLEKFIIKSSVQKLLCYTPLFQEIDKLLTPDKKIDMYNYLLPKLRNDAVDNKAFKSKVAFNAAMAIFQKNTDAHEAVKVEEFSKLVAIANEGFEISCGLQNDNKTELNANKIINSAIDNLCKSNFTEGFNLAILSREQREKILLGKDNRHC